MKRYLLLAGILFMCVLSSCSSDVEDAIPAVSQIVFKVNLDKVGDKGDVDQDKIKREFKDFIDQPTPQKLQALMQHPLLLASVLEKQAYGFTTNDYIGIVASVRSKSMLEDIIGAFHTQGLATKPQSQGGYDWTVYKKLWIIGYDGSRFLMMGPCPEGAQPALKQNMLALLHQSKDDSFAANTAFEKLQDKNGDLAVYAPLSNLPDLIGGQFALGVPAKVDPADVQVFLNVEFEKGKIHIDGESTSGNEDIARQIEAQGKTLPTIKGTFLNRVPSKFLIWGALGLDGSRSLQSLKKNRTVSDFLLAMNAGVDADMIMGSVKGDAAFCVPYLKKNNDIAFLFNAALARKDFLRDVPDWKKSVADIGKGSRMTNAGKDSYNLVMPDFNGRFGVNGMTFYATNDLPALRLKKGASAELKPYNGQIRNSVSFMLVNVAEARRIKAFADAIKVVGEYVPQVKSLVDNTRLIIIRAAGGNSGTMDFIATDSRLNYVQTLIK